MRSDRISVMVCGACFQALSAASVSVERDRTVTELSPGTQCEAHLGVVGPLGMVLPGGPMATGAALVAPDVLEAHREAHRARARSVAARAVADAEAARRERQTERTRGACGEETRIAAILLGSWSEPGKAISDATIAQSVDASRRLLAITKGW